MSFYQQAHGLLYFGRLCIGFAIGVTSMNVPIYISEIVPNEFRGRFVAWYTFIVVFGVMTANVISLLLRDQFFIIFWIAEIFVVGQIISVFFIIPESPRWLAKRGRQEEAEKVLELIYKPEYVQIYKRALGREIQMMRSTQELPLKDQYKVLITKYSRLLIIGCGLMVCQQVSGIVIAVQYGPTLIENAGFASDTIPDEIAAVILSLPLSFVRLLGTVIAIQVIDVRGRRKVLLETLPIMIICMAAIAVSGAFYELSDTIWIQTITKWVVLILMILFLFTYSAGMASIPWLINSEIYPLFLIGSASALSAFVNWVTSFVMITIF